MPLLPFVIASISLWYPDMTFGRGHTEDNDECVFMCNALFGGAQTGFIYLPLPSTNIRGLRVYCSVAMWTQELAQYGFVHFEFHSLGQQMASP